MTPHQGTEARVMHKSDYTAERNDRMTEGGTDLDEAMPMTRTELAMLWDGLNRWLGVHPEDDLFDERRSARLVRDTIDAEMTRRFGG